MSVLVEVCVEGVDGAMEAAAAGADRVELCASLMEGGLTPSPGVVQVTLASVRVPVMAIVRPRGGDFLYSAGEFASMVADVGAMRAAGVAGVVFGCLAADGTVDEARTHALVVAAGGVSCTFHRAFDMVEDASAALEALVRCGVDRVLMSGGAEFVGSMVRQAAGRVVVMGCGGLRAENIAEFVASSGVREVHFSAQVLVESGMVWRRGGMVMGSGDRGEYVVLRTDGEVVAAVRKEALLF